MTVGDIDIVNILFEWWWVILFVMRPGLVNLAGGYFAGVYVAHVRPDIAQTIMSSISNVLAGAQP